MIEESVKDKSFATTNISSYALWFDEILALT